MPKVSKGVLKSKMLEYFREVEKTGEDLVVMDRHKPVLKVVRLVVPKNPDNVFADVRGKFKASEKNVLTGTTHPWRTTRK